MEGLNIEQNPEEELEAAVKADDAIRAEAALKAMEALQKTKQEKLPEDIFNAIKEARVATGLEEGEINFKRAPSNDVFENYKNAESLEKGDGFEKVLVNGVEIMLSRKISDPITYAEALKWCTEDGGRMPTIEELEALYKSGKAESFDGRKVWSSSMKLNTHLVFNFETGKYELRTKEESVYATRAVADIN